MFKFLDFSQISTLVNDATVNYNFCSFRRSLCPPFHELHISTPDHCFVFFSGITDKEGWRTNISPLVCIVSISLGPALLAVNVTSFFKVGRHGALCSRAEMLSEVIRLHFLSAQRSSALVTGSPGLFSPFPSAAAAVHGQSFPPSGGLVPWAHYLRASWVAQLKTFPSILILESNVVQTASSE